MFTWTFWREALERAVKTAAQAAILYSGIGEGFDLSDMSWALMGSYAAGGFILSLLTSIATLGIGADNSPLAIEETP